MSISPELDSPDLGQPHHRTIFAVDIQGSTNRNNSAKAGLRRHMYRMVEECLRGNGITADHHDPLVDRGDGILALIHPLDVVPKTLILSKVIPTLRDMLVEHDRSYPEDHLRLRAVLHAGEVHNDAKGNFAEALDEAFRLLDAPEVKTAFKMCASPLLLVVSDLIYNTIITQGYPGIDANDFTPIVEVRVGKHRCRGWASPPAAVGVNVPAPARSFIKHAADRFGDRRHVV